MVGEFLKKKREEADITLDYVASQTCIRSGYLSAIENSKYERISAEIFIKGYIKEYAKMLSLNPSEVLHMYEEEKS